MWSCKNKCVPIGIMWAAPETNLSLSITGADSFVEGANTQYTASLTLSWVIGSPSTVLQVTLPTWITYVSSSDSGSEDDGVITWTLWDLIANKSVTFTINSDTPAPEYTVTGQVVSDFGNLWTTTASKDIEVESGVSWIEIILHLTDWNWFTWDETDWPTTSPSVFTVWWGDVLPNFTADAVYISPMTRRIWYLSDSVSPWALYIFWFDSNSNWYEAFGTYNLDNPSTYDVFWA